VGENAPLKPRPGREDCIIPGKSVCSIDLLEKEEIDLRGNCEKPTESNIELDPRVREAVLNAAPDGRIACSAARELADSLGVDPGVIGAACNQLRIKINSCALGCF
jgi:hypothetical protein